MPPLVLALATVLTKLALDRLHPSVSAFATSVLSDLSWISVALVLLVSVRMIAIGARRTSAGMKRPFVSVFVPFLVRLGKFLVLVIGSLSLLYRTGLFSRWQLGASLGLVGALVAYFARAALNSVVGGLQIVVSQPFRRGDFIRITGERGEVFEATVRHIELASTRLRTREGALMIVPNARMAAAVIENLSFLEQHRLYVALHLSLTTPAAAVRDLLVEIAATLEQSAHVDPRFPIDVRLQGIDERGLCIEVACTLRAEGRHTVARSRQELLLATITLVQRRCLPLDLRLEAP